MQARGKRVYIFYQHLSWDAHPSIETLSRYFEPPDADGAPGTDVYPAVRNVEVIEMLNLMCLAVIGVFLGVGELLGQDNTPTGEMAAEYDGLTKLSGQISQTPVGTAETACLRRAAHFLAAACVRAPRRWYWQHLDTATSCHVFGASKGHSDFFPNFYTRFLGT